ncbi:pleckstrin homology domain-containing family G member 3-like isoform X1 [Salvelinus namaycush]|uniref:Pleckstrin homology domain-containing family G member 3-like isoform X1 n=1 Tax=Salvelinus namaycush TaxID=8040 RepID=A0A8U1GVS7_SALNM|nr:pleckstrin homology domain-containing family G member 3-like isoform X1 [Salvelinus namaycush]XP_038865349.1 pleckstrin homology domain-containing family G member 3-like isoform X1 [Salvelinus namaycush]
MPEESHSALHKGPMGEESPRLYSALSISGGHERQDSYSRLCADPSAGEAERPVSLVSTLSSVSSRDSHSLYGSTSALPSTPPPPSGADIDLELSPAEGAREQPEIKTQGLSQGGTRDQWLDHSQTRSQCNNNATTNRRTNAPQTHTSPFATEAMAPNPKLSYVDRVVMEIIETERMYVRDLRSIVEDYLAHIIDMDNLPIRPDQVSSLFGNIEDIYEFNSELLQSLDMCENDPVAVASCFVDKSDAFEIYTQYCTNYPNSVGTLTDCMRSKTLAMFFRDRQAFLKRSLPLGSYLLKPVQRILKYHLLLQEIAKHFDPEEEGYEVVQEAIDTMTGVAWYINDMKRKHEHAVRLQEIQSLLINWKGPDLTTYGELVLEGTFHVQRAKNTRMLFLFDKMLLITKKRGEHYVYKTHILCSTLMLLDSAKDPLHFSVIHFKHPKQPHTVQAKTVEEKRLWAHHIKKLILENHHTIVPQKVKEAILEMDSLYPGSGKYRYSPERLKKAGSCRAEDFSAEGRPGRRTSEPGKEIVRTTKAILKLQHADSEGALLGDRRSLQPAASVSMLGSSLGEAERPGVLGAQEEIPSCGLSPSEDPKPGSLPCQGGTEQQQEEETEEEKGEMNTDDILMEDDQVADFAISCWHYRARALLSARFTTDEEHYEVVVKKAPMGERKETSAQEISEFATEETFTDQVYVEEVPPQSSASKVLVMEQSEANPPLCTDPDASPTLPPRQLETSQTLEPERGIGGGVEEEGRYRAGGEEEESDCSVQQDEMNSSVTNGECSEFGAAVGTETSRILPASVLDQGSIITEHFVGSLVVSEDLCSLGYPSPQLGSKSSSTPCLNTELEEKVQTLVNSTPEHPLLLKGNTYTPAPRPDDLMEVERRSTLSKQDRILIHKIRRYYEHAEHQDASFSIKRRESLSYIPAGLVRHLSQQLNSKPQDQAVPGHSKVSPNNRPTSWSVFDLPGLEKEQRTNNTPVLEPQKAADIKPRSQSVNDVHVGDEDEFFRPSLDMVQVWQDMEMEEVYGSLGKPKGIQGTEDIVHPRSHLSRKGGTSSESPEAEYIEPLRILEESDMDAVSEKSPSPITTSPDPFSGQESCQNKTPKSWERDTVSRAPLPRIISLRSGAEEDLILQDMEKMKNKVFQLARQYSQRIKNSRPVVRQRNMEAENHLALKNLPAVYEEKVQRRDWGRPNLTLSLKSNEQVVVHEQRTPSPVPSLNSGASSQVTSPCPNSPHSPVQTQSFHWPDVQELRSKYTNHRLDPGSSHPSPVSHSCSVPERMQSCTEGFSTSWSPNGYSSSCNCSTNTNSGLTDSLETMPSMDHQGGSSVGEAQPQPPLCRWHSFDHLLGTLPLQELQNLQETMRSCYIAGQATLPNEHKVIIVERVGGDGPEETGGKARVEEQGAKGKTKLKISKSLDYQYCAKRSALTSGKKIESSLVKNLRAKFQYLGSNTVNALPI